MADLKSNYLDLELKNPLMASASPLSKKVSLAKQLEDAGVSAIVMYSLFQEQIQYASKELDYFLSRGTDQFAEAITYFPDLGTYNVGVDAYLEEVRTLKECLSIPIIGSLNGNTSGGWVEYAKKIEQAGADALELNIYDVPTNSSLSSQDFEQAYGDLVSDVRKQIHIPLAIKLSPFFTALPSFASRLVKAGANSLVLFNRFIQPDLDIETLEVVPTLHLSTSEEIRLPLRWVAILHGRIQADLALTSGVHTANDVLRSVMAGANVTMIASELIAKGPGRATEILADMEKWMAEFEYTSVRQMLGSMSQKAVADASAFERANYMKALTSFDNRLRY